jgi:hypothetical protein
MKVTFTDKAFSKERGVGNCSLVSNFMIGMEEMHVFLLPHMFALITEAGQSEDRLGLWCSFVYMS